MRRESPLIMPLLCRVLSPEQIQQLQSQKSDIYMAREEWRKCLDGLKKALEAAPQSPSAGQIRERISYVEE